MIQAREAQEERDGPPDPHVEDGRGCEARRPRWPIGKRRYDPDCKVVGQREHQNGLGKMEDGESEVPAA